MTCIQQTPNGFICIVIIYHDRSTASAAPCLNHSRARQERESQRKALLERYNKGLLSPEARAKFEAEEAERAKNGGGKDDCVVC